MVSRLYHFFTMAITPATASAISGGLGFTGGLIGSIFSGRQAQKNRELQYKMFQEANQFNADQATLAYQRSIDEWNRQFEITNEYNSPSAQFQRMLDAGLNPYTANIGSPLSSVSAPSSPSASSVAPPSNMPFTNPVSDFMMFAQQGLDSALKALQTTQSSVQFNDQNGLLSAQKRLADSDTAFSVDTLPLRVTATNEANRALQTEAIGRTLMATMTNSHIPEFFQSNLQQALSSYLISRNDIKLSDLDVKSKQLDYDYLDKSFYTRLDNAFEDLKIKKGQRKLIENDVEFCKRMAEAQLDVMSANAESSRAAATASRASAKASLAAARRSDEMLPFDKRESTYRSFVNREQGIHQRKENYWFAPSGRQQSWHDMNGPWYLPNTWAAHLLNGIYNASEIIPFKPR